MGILSSLFNRPRPVEVSAADLAAVNGLFTPVTDKSPDMKKARAGWHAMRDWLVIGFHIERDRGPSADALDLALRRIGDILDKAPDDAATILLPRHEIGIVKASLYQMLQAADYLENVYAKPHMQKGSRALTKGYDHESRNARLADMYLGGACHLRDTHERMNAWLAGTAVPPASERKIERYAARMALFN